MSRHFPTTEDLTFQDITSCTWFLLPRHQATTDYNSVSSCCLLDLTRLPSRRISRRPQKWLSRRKIRSVGPLKNVGKFTLTKEKWFIFFVPAFCLCTDAVQNYGLRCCFFNLGWNPICGNNILILSGVRFTTKITNPFNYDIFFSVTIGSKTKANWRLITDGWSGGRLVKGTIGQGDCWSRVLSLRRRLMQINNFR